MSLAKTFLAIGIAIVLALFIGYGLWVVYTPPTDRTPNSCYDKYNCYALTDNCTAVPSDIPTDPPRKVSPECFDKIQKSKEYKDCEQQREICEKEFHTSSPRFKYFRNAFFILLILGILSVITGAFLSYLDGVGSGFIGGGILIIIYSVIYTSEFWRYSSKYLKLVALALTLAILIYIGYKKFDKNTTHKRSTHR